MGLQRFKVEDQVMGLERLKGLLPSELPLSLSCSNPKA